MRQLRVNIKGLTLTELEKFAESVGERRYRGKQLFEWLYRKRVTSFETMSSFSKSLRHKLTNAASIDSLSLISTQQSRDDGTTKYLFELNDGKRIESVLIPPRAAFDSGDSITEEEQKRMTLCVSTQVGCALDCAFCATASMGILRNLTAGEIIDQLIQATAESGRKITNVVYMGMGEPLMNYDQVMNSTEIISTGMGIAARRITISTAGWIPKIKQLADEQRKMKLAVSLHSLDENIRSRLMPVNRKFPLPRLLDALQYYYKATKLRVTFEYILFDGLNDQENDLRRLIKLSKSIPCKINIIPFHGIGFIHPTGFSAGLRPTPRLRAEDFVRKLREAHLTVFVRSSAGEDIDAACGQLALHDPHGRSVQKNNRPSHSFQPSIA